MKLHEVGDNFFYLRTAEDLLHRNIYVKRFEGNGDRAVMVFDPGTKADAPLVVEMLADVADGVENVDMVFVSHQDPDVASNARFLVTRAPRARALCSVDAWRLLRMTGIPDDRFYLLDNWAEETLAIKRTGHRVRPLPAHYCHFRGSMMLYDYESRVLFSGDLFGGVNTRPGDGIYADEMSWEGIALFHQIYMPSTRALRAALAGIANLDPPPEVIAPQHGDVIAGPWVDRFFDRLGALTVGADLTPEYDPDAAAGLAAFNEFFKDLAAGYPDVFEPLWRKLSSPDDFTTAFRFDGARLVELKVSLANAVVHVVNLFDKAVPAAFRDKALIMLAVALERHNITVPSYCLVGTGPKGDLFDVVR
jgi:glyoxylase-like metal-dependent hydrolase (beta-lactamase superfamily II)